LDYVSNSYDIVGDIAIMRVEEASRKHYSVIAQAIRHAHKNVDTVLAQVGPVRGDFRLRKLEHIDGEDKVATVHKESGCQSVLIGTKLSWASKQRDDEARSMFKDRRMLP